MGCWNGTDALTQLAIGAGDPCRLVILTGYKFAEHAGGGYCYSTGMFEPFALPIKGKYDDYGSIDHIEEGLNTQFIVRWFEEKIKAGEIEFSDRAHTMDKYDGIIPTGKGKDKKLDIKRILDWIERGYVGHIEKDTSAIHRLHDLERHRKAKDDYEKLTPAQLKKAEELEQIIKLKGGDPKVTRWFSFMLIHEDVFQAAMAGAGGFETEFMERDRDDSKKDKWVKCTLADHIKKNLNKYLDGIRDHIKAEEAIKKLPEGDAKAESSSVLLELKWLMHEMRNDLWGHGLINDFLRKDIAPWVIEAVRENNPGLDQWGNNVVEYRLLCDYMELSRKGFAPQAGAGSQSDEYYLHKALAETVLKICHERGEEQKRLDAEHEEWVKKYEAEQAAKKAAKSKKASKAGAKKAATKKVATTKKAKKAK